MSAAGDVPRSASPRPRLDVTAVIRRGFDSTIANWQLILLRVAENILLGILAVATVVAIVVPLVVSIGLSRSDLSNPDNLAGALRTVLTEHWLILIYIVVASTIALIVMMALHSFVMAGVARVFVDAERAAGAAADRIRFRVFSIEHWMAGGKDAWWPVFWIYNIAYGAAGIVMLLPLIPVALLLVLLAEAAPVAIVLTCLGLIVFAFVSILVLVATNILCQKAIVIVSASRIDAAAALGRAWRSIRDDFGRNASVAFVMMVMIFGGTGVLSMISIAFAAPGAAAPYTAFIFMPLRLAMSIVSSAYSAIVINWFIASFAALSAEGA